MPNKLVCKPLTYLELVRRQKGWSQTRLSDLADVLQTHISMMERGRFLPTHEERVRLALVLGISEDLLLRHVPEQTAVGA